MSLLRASGEALDTSIDASAVGEGANVAAGAQLVRFAEAAVTRAPDLAARRSELQQAVGAAGLVEAAATVSAFEGLNRVADATGIQLDDGLDAESGDLRSALDLERFAGSANTVDRGLDQQRATDVMSMFR